MKQGWSLLIAWIQGLIGIGSWADLFWKVTGIIYNKPLEVILMAVVLWYVITTQDGVNRLISMAILVIIGIIAILIVGAIF